MSKTLPRPRAKESNSLQVTKSFARPLVKEISSVQVAKSLNNLYTNFKVVDEMRSSIGNPSTGWCSNCAFFMIHDTCKRLCLLNNPQAKAKSCRRNAKFDWGQSTGRRLSGACPDGKFARVPQENKR